MNGIYSIEEMNDATMLDQIGQVTLNKFVASARSEGFNGISCNRLISLCPDEARLRKLISKLVQDHGFSCAFTKTDVNPHIKRLPPLEVVEQVTLVGSEPLQEICLYPSEHAVRNHPNLPNFSDRPYTQALMFGAAQLEFVGFELGVLGRYIDDPRYEIAFHDYQGHMSIKDEHYLNDKFVERDKIALQSFGLGFDSNKEPKIVVFYRYLSDLSPEHQQYWKSFRCTKPVKLCKQYFESSIEGKFWENRSIRFAIEEEIRLINEMTRAIYGKSIFKSNVPETGAIELTSFLLPTQNYFNSFVQSMDKILSDNLDKSFFKGLVEPKERVSDGEGGYEIRHKGTLRLLSEWLLQEGRWESQKLVEEVVIEPLRRVRSLRQKPSHSLARNSHSVDFAKTRKQILWDVFNSLSNIRAALSTHPKCSSVNVPDWLDGSIVEVI